MVEGSEETGEFYFVAVGHPQQGISFQCVMLAKHKGVARSLRFSNYILNEQVSSSEIHSTNMLQRGKIYVHKIYF